MYGWWKFIGYGVYFILAKYNIGIIINSVKDVTCHNISEFSFNY